MKERQFGAIVALVGAATLSLLLGVVYYVVVDGDALGRDGSSLRIDFTIDVVRSLALALCAIAATRRALAAAGLVAAALVLQFGVLHQPLGMGFWSSLLQGVAVGYGVAVAAKAGKLRAKLL